MKQVTTWLLAWTSGGAVFWLLSHDVRQALLVLAVALAYVLMVPRLQRFEWERRHLMLGFGMSVAISAVALLPLPQWLTWWVLAGALVALLWMYETVRCRPPTPP